MDSAVRFELTCVFTTGLANRRLRPLGYAEKQLERPDRFELPTICFRGRAFKPLRHSSDTGGEKGIRTLVPTNRPSRFQRAPFDHSGISPKMAEDSGFEPECRGSPDRTAFKTGAIDRSANLPDLVPQRGFEPRKALVLSQVGVPISTSHRGKYLVSQAGFEPARLKASDFKSGAYTDSAIETNNLVP